MKIEWAINNLRLGRRPALAGYSFVVQCAVCLIHEEKAGKNGENFWVE